MKVLSILVGRTISNFIKELLLLFFIALNHSITDFMLRHWFICVFCLILLLISSRWCFLSTLISDMSTFRFILEIYFVIFKGATKSHFTNYSCVVIVLLNTALCRSAFSTVSFSKQVFRLSVLSLNEDIKLCVIMLCNFDM